MPVLICYYLAKYDDIFKTLVKIDFRDHIKQKKVNFCLKETTKDYLYDSCVVATDLKRGGVRKWLIMSTVEK